MECIELNCGDMLPDDLGMDILPSVSEVICKLNKSDIPVNINSRMFEFIKAYSYALSYFSSKRFTYGELRHEPYVSLHMGPESSDLVFIFKLDNNGSTYRIKVTGAKL